MENLNWLNENLVSDILVADFDAERADLSVKTFEAKLALDTGENFSSFIYRLRVRYEYRGENAEKSYIVKVLFPEDTPTGKVHKHLRLFDKELRMYGEINPIVDRMIRKLDPEFKLSPRMIHSLSGSPELMVLEDLSPLGYRLADKNVGLDLVHCKAVLEKLARFHASSMILNKRDPSYRRPFYCSIFCEGISDDMRNYLTNGVKQAIELMKSLPECKKYVNFYEQFLENFVAESIELSKPIPEDVDDFNVLNHGDFWIQNIMFKYDDDGRIKDLSVIDWQMTRFNNPGNDLNYFFYTSCADRCREDHYEDLLKVYISTLREVLIKLNHVGFMPTLDDLKAKLLRQKNIALMTPCIVLPLAKINKKDSDQMTAEGIMDSDVNSSSRNSLFSNEAYHKALVAALQHLEKIGFIDLSL